MNYNRAMCCPDCGSGHAVPKDVAWDALVEVPRKVAQELDRLRSVEAMAADLFSETYDELRARCAVTVMVSGDALEALRRHFSTDDEDTPND